MLHADNAKYFSNQQYNVMQAARASLFNDTMRTNADHTCAFKSSMTVPASEM